MGQGRHVNATTGAIVGTPDGATKRARGVPTCNGAAMRTQPLRPPADQRSHETREGRAEIERCRHENAATGNEMREECADMGRGRHVNAATRAFGGASDGATTRAKGLPGRGGAAMRTQPSVPHGATERAGGG